MKLTREPSLLLLSILILMAALPRLLPHWPNFTPVGAMALFGAAYLPRKAYAFVVPVLALYLSDLLLNNWVYGEFNDHFVWAISPYVYAAFCVMVAVGFLLRGRVRPLPVVGASLTASVLFFLITNFGSWLIDPMYPKNAAGLLAAYAAGVPFFWNTLAGDLFFCAVLFGGYAWVSSRQRRRMEQAAA